LLQKGASHEIRQHRKNGAARDEALKRRNGTKREVLRLKPMPNEQAENPVEPKDEKTSE
jgi:hypothetical protein